MFVIGTDCLFCKAHSQAEETVFSRHQLLVEQLEKQKVLAHLFIALFILAHSGYYSVFY